MADVLSQSEIDALLSALQSGEVLPDEIREHEAEKGARVYDFRRAMRFSKDHMRILRRIHENFARMMATQLSGELRSVVQIQVESVEQLPYEEFIRSIPALTIIQLMGFEPLHGKVAIEINPQIVFGILDRMMGGDIRGPYRERELTEIEAVLVKRLLASMPRLVRDSWQSVAELSPELLSLETNPQFLQLTTPNETVLVITISAHVGGTSGLINICIPHVTLEPLIPKLTNQNFLGMNLQSKVRQEDAEQIRMQLQQASVQLTVQLGGTQIFLNDVAELEVGDLIPLDASINNPVVVDVDGIPSFLGAIGTSRRKYAIKILKEYREEEYLE